MNRLRLTLVILLLSCIASAQEIRRPTANIAPTAGTTFSGSAYINSSGVYSQLMPNFYDASGLSTGSSITSSSSLTLSEFTTWGAASGSYSALTLNINYSVVSTTGSYDIAYSVNGGSTWTDWITGGGNVTQATHTLTLSPSQDLSLLKVVVGVTSSTSINLTGYDIWTSGTLAAATTYQPSVQVISRLRWPEIL